MTTLPWPNSKKQHDSWALILTIGGCLAPISGYYRRALRPEGFLKAIWLGYFGTLWGERGNQQRKMSSAGKGETKKWLWTDALDDFSTISCCGSSLKMMVASFGLVWSLRCVRCASFCCNLSSRPQLNNTGDIWTNWIASDKNMEKKHTHKFEFNLDLDSVGRLKRLPNRLPEFNQNTITR